MIGIGLGIDLGTANVTICIPGRGVVLREPSVIAVDSNTGAMIACGREAFEMLERTPGSISAIRPMTKGVISEYEYAEKMLRIFVRKVCAYKVLKPRVAVSVPSSVTEVERRSVFEAVSAAGTRKVVMVEDAVAAAVGAGLDITAARGSMVINIGAGTTNVAVLSLKGMTSSTSVRVGGNDIDEAIVRHMQLKHNHVIGRMTAEQVKKEICCATPVFEKREMNVKGRNAVSGLPSICRVHSEEISEAAGEPLREIFNAIQLVLESTPPELAADIMDAGLVICGGGALMNGMAVAIEKYTGVPVRIADVPLDCVAVGAAKMLENGAGISSGVYKISQTQFPPSDSSRL